MAVNVKLPVLQGTALRKMYKASTRDTPSAYAFTIKMAQSPIVLPISTIQPDFESLIADVKDGIVPEETFWVSCYKTGENSVHAKTRLALNEYNRDAVDYDGLGGVEFRGNEVEVSISTVILVLT